MAFIASRWLSVILPILLSVLLPALSIAVWRLPPLRSNSAGPASAARAIDLAILPRRFTPAIFSISSVKAAYSCTESSTGI
jgi:hypothetical protein